MEFYFFIVTLIDTEMAYIFFIINLLLQKLYINYYFDISPNSFKS